VHLVRVLMPKALWCFLREGPRKPEGAVEGQCSTGSMSPPPCASTGSWYNRCRRRSGSPFVAGKLAGGIGFGLTAALKGCISIAGGQVQQSNFDDYPLLRLHETPEIEVVVLPSQDPPSGIGEMANPVIAPAVANAIFAAAGKRIRRLPIKMEDVLSG
jgi:hypothetical protein